MAFILSKFIKNKRNVFKVSFASLFALACLLDLPTAIMRAKVVALADHINDSYMAFEALMKYETDPAYKKNCLYSVYEPYRWKTRSEFADSVRAKHPEYDNMSDQRVYAEFSGEYPVYKKQIEENYLEKKNLTRDEEKFFALSYCYATGCDGCSKDIGKAVQLCQRAAAEGNYHAQRLLRNAGFSWKKK